MTLWQIWWLSLAVKTILLPFLPITPDEAYYMAWARHPAISYFDHPPYIAWVMAAGLPLWKTALTVRWPGVVMNHLSLIPWFGILSRLGLSKRAQVFWILLILLGPLTGLGSFIVTPDAPLVFFWSASMWALLWTMEKPTTSRWLLVGVFAGLGMLSKYTMVLFFPAALLWIIWEDHWSVLWAPGPWIALAASLALFSPVVLWNVQHEMASFTFQGGHGLAGVGLHPQWVLEYLSAQLGLLNPLAVIVIFWVLMRNYSRRKFLVTFGVFPLLFFFVTSFKGRVEANWPVCAYPALMALAASAIDEAALVSKAKKFLKTGLVLSSLFCVAVISHVIHPWIPIPQDKDHTQVVREGFPTVEEVKDIHPLFVQSYQLAAILSYYRSPDHEVFKLAGLDRKDFYDFLDESRPRTPAFLILRQNQIFPPKLEDHYSLSDPKGLSNHLVLYHLNPKPGLPGP